MMQFIIISLFLVFAYSSCVHDDFSKETVKHIYNDFEQGRLLQESNIIDKIRIFVDYSQVTVGTAREINYVKRVTNITATYFYNVLQVKRLTRLFYPQNTSRVCNALTVPQVYVKQGTIGDLGIVCGNQNTPSAVYVAKSTPCAFLASSKRPIWGMIQWNNPFLKFQQYSFQQILFVGIHEMTHILGFSAIMYQLYPAGNPLKQYPSGDNYLSSPKINSEVYAHYGCNNSKGMPLEDQDGTLIPSHWQRKVAGNQYMISSNKKGSFVSRITLALLESTGWYPVVNYDWSEPTTWGKNKSCSFLSIDDCTSNQLCGDSNFYCDWQGTAVGRCDNDLFAGACKIVRYFVNTICIDQSFQLKNLNSGLMAYQRGGYNSRCFASTYRSIGTTLTKLNNRCYISVCSYTGDYIYILVGSYIIVCRIPGEIIQSPLGMQGDLTCPKNFDNYCKNKQTCAFHCNNNGACINGQCLCTGNNNLTPTCLDVSFLLAPIGNTGGILQSQSLNGPRVIKQYSLNSKCYSGTIYDNIFGQCLKCKDIFNCENCTSEGCTACDNGYAPINGFC